MWQLMLRIIVGGYWLFFSSQRWFDRSGVQVLVNTAAQGNYVPFYGDVLRIFVSPNLEATAIAITVLETTVGLMIILGVFIKIAGLIGAFVNLNLTLTFSFCQCPWAEADFPLVFWFYFAPMLLNLQIVLDKSANVIGIQRLFAKFLEPKSL
ncbi:MAG: DoxX family membrane protein [Thaumarchaeota archaeon]|nr:DoxX family membrane protein [Nitrososphaerota archaeon]